MTPSITIGMMLMTVAILQFTVIPLIADLNRSHAANPGWPGHARLHVVLQALTTSAIGCLALFLLWSGRVSYELALCLATMLAGAALAPFFASVLTRKLYGGELTPVPIGIAGVRLGRIEGNVLNFGSSAVLFLVGRLIA
jgi:hypothetical protein